MTDEGLLAEVIGPGLLKDGRAVGSETAGSEWFGVGGAFMLRATTGLYAIRSFGEHLSFKANPAASPQALRRSWINALAECTDYMYAATSVGLERWRK